MRTEFLKLTLISSVVLAFFTSCSPDECLQEYGVQKVIITFDRPAVSTIDLSGMKEDLTINPSDATNGEVQTTGDVNLNGFKLSVVNVRLTVNGNLNGGGTLRTQGNFGAVCVTGDIQNNPDTEGVNFECENLSTPTLTERGTIIAECGLEFGTIVEVDGVKYRIGY